MSVYDELVELERRTIEATTPAESARAHHEAGIAFRQVANAHAGIARDYRGARHAFERATGHLRQAAETTRRKLRLGEDSWDDHYRNLEGALITAVLTHDESLRREAATETFATPERYTEVYPDMDHAYYYLKTLAAVIVDHGSVDAYCDETHRAINGREDVKSVGPTGLWMALNGLIEDDDDWIRRGLQAHVDAYPPADAPGDPIAHAGTAIAILAHERGYEDLIPDDPDVPEPLLTPPDSR